MNVPKQRFLALLEFDSSEFEIEVAQPSTKTRMDAVLSTKVAIPVNPKNSQYLDLTAFQCLLFCMARLPQKAFETHALQKTCEPHAKLVQFVGLFPFLQDFGFFPNLAELYNRI